MSWREGFDVDGAELRLRLEDDNLARSMAALRCTIRAHLVAGGELVVIDIRSLSVVSTTTLAALLSARRHCKSLGGRLVVVGPAGAQAPTSANGLYELLDVEQDGRGAGSL